jgi:uncharacterized protein involved in exopolysaccharide biosynthesis
MKFSKFEELMKELGVSSLAEIARKLETTPQAVSNWKARDQVPYHIVNKINKISSNNFITQSPVQNMYSSSVGNLKAISFSDILITIAEHIKGTFLITFISVFIAFTHVQFIKPPKYLSQATILLPSASVNNLSSISGLASQIGVSIPGNNVADLSSPSLIPQLLDSRIFAEKMFEKEFYTKKYDKKLSLLAILTHGDLNTTLGKDILVTRAFASFKSMIKLEEDVLSAISKIKVTAAEPLFAKELAEAALFELESLNRYYKSQTVNDKVSFISNRINNVVKDLDFSEKKLKNFSEKNRQISSPSLQLELNKMTRDLEIQKGIYLTLRQQLELAKIEEVQESSIFQVLDKAQVPLGPYNKNVKTSVFLAAILGIGIGILIGFIRSYINNESMDERKKIRRVKYFLKKKTKDIFLDKRVSGIIALCLLIGLPYYLGYKSQNPQFFGLYSAKVMFVNTIYVLGLLSTCGLYIYLILMSRKKI